MPDPRARYLVINRRQSGAWPGEIDQPLYGDVDAEPLPAQPDGEGSGIASRLSDRLRSAIRIGDRAQGAAR
jgi:hypothetical protein